MSPKCLVYTNSYGTGMCSEHFYSSWLSHSHECLPEADSKLTTANDQTIYVTVGLMTMTISTGGAGGGGADPQKTSKTSTTLMLLSVSFFYVATTLPMTFVYIVHPAFEHGQSRMTDEQVYSFYTWLCSAVVN